MTQTFLAAQDERVKGPDLVRRLMHLYWRFARPMTLGTRAAILHPERGVFLIRHGYVTGWHLPGGGVEAGETLAESMAREVWEETHIEVVGPPALHGMFLNRHASNRDHVAVFVVRSFREGPPRPPDAEIAEGRFFSIDDLPADVTRGTRARLQEILGGQPPALTW